MNASRLLLAIVVAFVVVFVTDYLIHSMWLMPDYNATHTLWRPESEMTARIGWMFFAQFLFAATLCVVWALWISGRDLGTAIAFGFLMGLFQSVWPIAYFVVAPIPGALAVKWILSGIVQVILVSLAAALVYRRPRTITA
jgi:hypothetical protein